MNTIGPTVSCVKNTNEFLILLYTYPRTCKTRCIFFPRFLKKQKNTNVCFHPKIYFEL